MKNYIPVLIILAFLASCSTKPENGYILSGSIKGKVPAKVYLQQYINGKMQVLDSANFINQEFKLKGKITEPDYYYLRLGSNENILGFFLENSKIDIIAHIDSLQKAVIIGSAIQNQYNDFKGLQNKFEKELKGIRTKYNNAETGDLKNKFRSQFDSIDNLWSSTINDFISTTSNSILAPYIIRRELIYDINLQELEEITNQLSIELKDNKYAKQVYEHISVLRKLQPGMDAPLFTQNNTESNPVKLEDYRGKYLLIDFWASWCNPCRKANPIVLKTYKRYAYKNFEILGVSMDSEKTKWLQAIENDQLPWTQVSALKGWQNPVAKLYAVNSIPHAILIDPEGKIVKRGVEAEELESILKEIFYKPPPKPIKRKVIVEDTTTVQDQTKQDQQEQLQE